MDTPSDILLVRWKYGASSVACHSRTCDTECRTSHSSARVETDCSDSLRTCDTSQQICPQVARQRVFRDVHTDDKSSCSRERREACATTPDRSPLPELLARESEMKIENDDGKNKCMLVTWHLMIEVRQVRG